MRAVKLLVSAVLLAIVLLGTVPPAAKAQAFFINFSISTLGPCSDNAWAVDIDANWNIDTGTFVLHQVEVAAGTLVADNTFDITGGPIFGGGGPGSYTSQVLSNSTFFTASQPYTYTLETTYSMDGVPFMHNLFTITCNAGAVTSATVVNTPISGAGSSGPVVTGCNLGGDGRVKSNCAERLAIYCDATANPPSITIWGVGPDSKGFKLTTINFDDILNAGPNGTSKQINNKGTVSVSVDAQNNFWFAWNGQVNVNGNSFYADGQPEHGFAKGFACNFKR
jgi:hypothetical protein